MNVYFILPITLLLPTNNSNSISFNKLINYFNLQCTSAVVLYIHFNKHIFFNDHAIYFQVPFPNLCNVSSFHDYQKFLLNDTKDFINTKTSGFCIFYAATLGRNLKNYFHIISLIYHFSFNNKSPELSLIYAISSFQSSDLEKTRIMVLLLRRATR